jgi:hypothetical protein
MVFKATLNNMTVLSVEDPEKITDLSQVTANFITKDHRGCRGRDRIVVGLTTTYTTSAYHH